MIIFFPGQGASKKVVRYEYKNDKFIKNDFIDKLNKIGFKQRIPIYEGIKTLL